MFSIHRFDGPRRLESAAPWDLITYIFSQGPDEVLVPGEEGWEILVLSRETLGWHGTRKITHQFQANIIQMAVWWTTKESGQTF